MTATSTVNGSRVKGSPATGCRRGWRPGPVVLSHLDQVVPLAEGGAQDAARLVRLPGQRVVAGEVVEQHARVARRQVTAMQDRLELAGQHVVALLAAGQGGDVAQVRDGVVDAVGADAGGAVVALAQDLVRAMPMAPISASTLASARARHRAMKVGVPGVERRVRGVHRVVQCRVEASKGRPWRVACRRRASIARQAARCSCTSLADHSPMARGAPARSRSSMANRSRSAARVACSMAIRSSCSGSGGGACVMARSVVAGRAGNKGWRLAHGRVPCAVARLTMIELEAPAGDELLSAACTLGPGAMKERIGEWVALRDRCTTSDARPTERCSSCQSMSRSTPSRPGGTRIGVLRVLSIQPSRGGGTRELKIDAGPGRRGGEALLSIAKGPELNLLVRSRNGSSVPRIRRMEVPFVSGLALGGCGQGAEPVDGGVLLRRGDSDGRAAVRAHGLTRRPSRPTSWTASSRSSGGKRRAGRSTSPAPCSRASASSPSAQWASCSRGWPSPPTRVAPWLRP